MKKLFSLVMVLVLLLVLVPTVSAQSSTTTKAPGTWTSSINIQNVDDVAASVQIIFYDQDGAIVKTFTLAPDIPVGGSRTVVLAYDVDGLDVGQYSAELQSTAEIQVIANSTSKVPVTAGAYQGVGVDELSTSLFFPGVYKSYYTFNSEIVLQNPSDAAAAVAINFYDPATGTEIVAAKIEDTIPAKASRIFAMSDFASVPSGLLSAKVVSDQALAGVVNVWSPTIKGEFSDYNAFIEGSGDTKIFAPGLYKNYYGFVSALTIQNVGTDSTEITVTYSNGTTEVKTLASYQSVELYQPGNSSLPSGNVAGVFSAKIESDGEPIVGLVNVEDKVKGLLGSYNLPKMASSQVGCPVVMKEYYGWYTGTTVQNVGTEATNITITYAGGETRTFANVLPNGTVNIVEIGTPSSLPSVSSVSAVITSSNGQPLVAVVQENNDRYNANPGDYLLAYTCVAKPEIK